MAKTPKIKTGPANDTTWEPLVEVSNESGVLKGVGIAHGDEASHWIKIELDDEEIVEDKLSTSYGEWSNNGMHLDFPFSEEMKVSGKDDDIARATTRYWISYMIESDGGESDGE